MSLFIHTGKFLKYLILTILFIMAMASVALFVSPWPAVLVIRHMFNTEAHKANQLLEKHVPLNITATENQQYDPADTDAFLNAYYPSAGDSSISFPVIVWIHGGGLISGNKEQIANYCKILSSNGYVVVTIDYTTAPEAQYPTPLLQTNKALRYISEHAKTFRANTSSIMLAGDSGGSMIAVQTANIIYNEDYALLTKVEPGISSRQLKGLILYCGIYDISNIRFEGPFGFFMKTVFWSYFGKKDISGDIYARSASVFEHIDNRFPPSFISAGNGDPLLPQSLALAGKLSTLGINAETLFFPASQHPELPHEYQFNLDTEAGQLALERSLLFLKKLQSE